MRHIRTSEIKARAEELAEGYQDAKDEEFDNQFRDMFSSYFNTKLGMHLSVTEDDVQGLMDSFDFPDENTWAFDQVSSELDDIGDQAMEQARDEAMGL